MEDDCNLTRLYQKNKQDLWKFASRLSRNDATSEDILQSSFLRFLKLCREGKMKTDNGKIVLFRLVYQEWIAQFRKQKLQDLRVKRLEENIQPFLQEKNSPEQSMEILKILEEELERDRLNDTRKGILQLRILSGMSAKMTARILNMSQRTYHREYNKLLQDLREAFREAGYRGGDLE